MAGSLAVLLAVAGTFASLSLAGSGGSWSGSTGSTESSTNDSTSSTGDRTTTSGHHYRHKHHHHHGGGTTTGSTTTGSTTTESTTTESTSTEQSSSYCGLDAEWLKTSLEGDLFEIQGGKLALSKSHDPNVQALAQRLIDDHTQSYSEGADLAKSLGIEVPTDPSPTEQWELEELGEMHGAEFNHDYTELEVKDHEQDISETQDEIDMGCNPDVKSEAAKDLPMLQMHLQLAEAAFTAVGSEHEKSSSH
jgi:putative membrane protein